MAWAHIRPHVAPPMLRGDMNWGPFGNNPMSWPLNQHLLGYTFKKCCVTCVQALMNLFSIRFQAAISALQYQPAVNAVIDGDDIIYRDYVDISIAVGTPKVCLSLNVLSGFSFHSLPFSDKFVCLLWLKKGLVVPVLRNAERMNFAEIEKEINSLAKKATQGSISIDEMAGGTFTISNGGVYGSLISTPIINPPQACMHSFYPINNMLKKKRNL